jgi:putative Mn2+ efflux pump MntP
MHKPNDEEIMLFNNSETGKFKNIYFKRTLIIGILSIMISLIWVVLNFYYMVKWYEYISPSILIIFGMYFIIHGQKVKYQEINKYIYSQKKKKQN